MKKYKIWIIASIVLLIVIFCFIFSFHLKKPSEKVSNPPKDYYHMSYLFGNPKSYLKEVDASNGFLQEVSPNYFELTSDGHLQVSTITDSTFISQIHKRNMKIVPFLNNNWDKDKSKAALDNRAILAREIADKVEQLNVDGVGIDFEGLSVNERDSFTDFMKQLKSDLPKGKTLEIAIGVTTDGEQKDWIGMYDYEVLGKIADTLMMMTYDEHWEGDTDPGPVASVPFDEACIQYAVTKMPANKLLLGIPFYGRVWKLDDTIKGKAISMYQTENVLNKFHATSELDSTSNVMKGTFTIPANDSLAINYKTLTSGDYIFWYDTDKTIASKLELVKKYGLKGTGTWSLGQESSDVWNVFHTVFNKEQTSQK